MDEPIDLFGDEDLTEVSLASPAPAVNLTSIGYAASSVYDAKMGRSEAEHAAIRKAGYGDLDEVTAKVRVIQEGLWTRSEKEGFLSEYVPGYTAKQMETMVVVGTNGTLCLALEHFNPGANAPIKAYKALMQEYEKVSLRLMLNYRIKHAADKISHLALVGVLEAMLTEDPSIADVVTQALEALRKQVPKNENPPQGALMFPPEERKDDGKLYTMMKIVHPPQPPPAAEPIAEPLQTIAEPTALPLQPPSAAAEPIAEPLQSIAEPLQSIAEPIAQQLQPPEAAAEPIAQPLQPPETAAERTPETYYLLGCDLSKAKHASWKPWRTVAITTAADQVPSVAFNGEHVVVVYHPAGDDAVALRADVIAIRAPNRIVKSFDLHIDRYINLRYADMVRVTLSDGGVCCVAVGSGIMVFDIAQDEIRVITVEGADRNISCARVCKADHSLQDGAPFTRGVLVLGTSHGECVRMCWFSGEIMGTLESSPIVEPIFDAMHSNARLIMQTSTSLAGIFLPFNVREGCTYLTTQRTMGIAICGTLLIGLEKASGKISIYSTVMRRFVTSFNAPDAKKFYWGKDIAHSQHWYQAIWVHPERAVIIYPNGLVRRIAMTDRAARRTSVPMEIKREHDKKIKRKEAKKKAAASKPKTKRPVAIPPPPPPKAAKPVVEESVPEHEKKE